MRSNRKLTRTVAAVAIAAMSLAACSSQGGAQNNTASAPGAGTPQTGGKTLTIAMITHELVGDTFWDKIRAGAEASAKEHGIDLKYSSNDRGPEQATLVQNAIDSKVDGIAVTLSSADAVIPAAKKAADAGIPVVVFNQGLNQYKDAGAKMFFGSDEFLGGETIGTQITQEGGGKALCVLQAQGSVALEDRCAGVKKTFPNTENLYTNGSDLPSVQQTVGAKLAQDPSITHVVALSATLAMATIQAQSDAGTNHKLIAFDLNQDAAKAIQEGKIEFAVDQQPYVQGYLAVDSLWLALTNGNDIGGGKPVLTGPSIVDKTNIDQILPYTGNNTR